MVSSQGMMAETITLPASFSLSPPLLDLLDGPNRWDVYELVDEPLAVHLGEDAPLVVVPAGEVSAVHHSSLVELQPVTYDTQVL